MECPKCNYKRLESDQAPEWQCPSCGVAYNKVKAKKSVKPQAQAIKKTLSHTEKNDWFVYILIGIGIFLFTYFDSLDGVISWNSNNTNVNRYISLENQKNQYYFILAIHYFFSLLAFITGISKYIGRKIKK